MENKLLDLCSLLDKNDYPGRGILLGKTPDGAKSVLAYFIMGRSENSRNRVFEKTEDGIRTRAFDPSKMSDPSLIIYHPVRTHEQRTIVTNGDQTDTIYDFVKDCGCFVKALKTRRFEPDKPNFTPRISGILYHLEDFSYKLSILKAADENGSACNRFTYDYEPLSGVGHLIHTYEKNGDPIPSFQGEPRAVAVPDNMDTLAEMLWSSLNADNKVSLYVRYTDLKTLDFEEKIINKNS